MFYKTDVNGNRIPAMEGGYLDFVKDITGATTLAIEESGKVCTLNAAAGAQVSLPAVSATWKFKFVVKQAFDTTDWTIVAASNVIQGGAVVNNVHVPASNENTISFVATADAVGDYIEVWSDGEQIYCSGSGTAAGSITFTAP